MKTLITSLVIGLFATAAHATTVNLECNGNHPNQIQLQGYNAGIDSFSGDLSRAFNGAPLSCHRNGWFYLKEFGIPMKCVGVWDHSFSNQSNEDVQQVVEVFISKDSAGKISAQYVENFDLRNSIQDKIVLPCSVQE